MRVFFGFGSTADLSPSARQAPIAGHPGVAIMGAFIPRDVQEFLDGYPDLRDNRSQSSNFKFYSNELRCRPDRKLISEIHEEYAARHHVPPRPRVLLGGGTADVCFAVPYVDIDRWFGDYSLLEAKHGYIQWL